MPSKRHLRKAGLPVGLAAGALVLAGCTPQEQNGWLPGFMDENGEAYSTAATNHTEMVSGLWTTSWAVLLGVGVITWGLMLWAAVAYRRRKGQTGLPVQLRYNMPIEIFYTIVPFIFIIGFFFFTARDQAILETQYEDPDVQIVATGKQWSWDFEYVDQENTDDSVWTMGIQAQPAENGDIDQESLPTLYLPVDKKVHIQLESRDVAHSFWIIDFLYKKDMYIGRDNSWSFTPTREGTFQGKCAELCGEYHSMMLFNVKVVSEAEYEDYLASLEQAGQTGDIGDEYDRLNNLPGTGAQSSEEEGH